MVILFLLVMGITAFREMPWESDPDVEIPYISVFVPYPGAGPEEIEQRIIIPLEDAISVIEGVDSVSSTAFENGAQIVVGFELEVDQDVAASDVRDALDRTKAQFPDDADQATLYKIDIGAMPIFTVGFTAKRSPRDLRKLIYDEVRPRLAQVTGVASVTVTGGEVREIQVLAYRDRLDAVGLSVSGLAAAISSQNLDVPSGTIKEGRRTYAVRVLGQFEDLDEIRSLMISTPLGGRMPLSSLAEVRDTVVEPDRYARVDGENSVTVAVVKQSGANTVQVVRDLRAVLTEMVGSLEENGKEGAAPKTGFLGADIKAVVANDDSEFVLQSIEDVLEDLLYGALLAAIVVFLFLHNFRGMIIVALAIPTAMLATFFPIGMGFGFTLNMMVMLGFTLSIGILVDDSVVVLENIERHLHRGEQPKAAAYNGRAEIGGAAVAITLVDVVVFIPVAMMGGMIGRFFFSFGITAGICALLSLLMSFTLTPMLASWWFRRREQHPAHLGGLWQRLFAMWNVGYGRLENAYRPVLAGAVRHPYITVGVGYAVLVAAVALVMPRLPFEFFPASDQASVTVSVETAVGTRIEETDRLVRQIETRLMDKAKYPEIEHITAVVGSAGGGGLSSGDSGGQYANVNVALYPKGERRANRQRSDQEVAAALREHLADLPSAKIQVSTSSGMGGGGTVDLNVLCEDQKTLGEASVSLAQKISQIEGLMYVDLSSKPGRPEIHCEIDRVRANDLGLTVAGIGMAVRTAFSGDTSAKFREGGDEYDLRVELTDADRSTVANVANLYVGLTPDEAPVMLRDVADVYLATGPNKIERYNRQRTVTVSATMDPSAITMGDAQDAMKSVADENPIPGVTTAWTGRAKMMVESFGYLVQALALSIVLVYIVTAGLYNSLLQPLNVMLTIPMALVGGVVGLWVTGSSLSVVAMIGVIQLVGLVGKNAILMVDYTNTLRSRGLERTPAILEAGPTRMKPILMTTIAAICAALPIALATGEGSETRAPMAIVVIFGLALSTLLSLLVVPCTYAILDQIGAVFGRLGKRIGAFFAERKENGRSNRGGGGGPIIPEMVDPSTPSGRSSADESPADDDRWARPQFPSDPEPPGGEPPGADGEQGPEDGS